MAFGAKVNRSTVIRIRKSGKSCGSGAVSRCMRARSLPLRIAASCRALDSVTFFVRRYIVAPADLACSG
jgi:hypothetical protein